MSWDTLNLIDSSDAASGGGPPRFAGRIGANGVETGCELGVVMIFGGRWAGWYRLSSSSVTFLSWSRPKLYAPTHTHTPVMASTTNQIQEKRPAIVDDDSDVDDLDGAEIQRLQY